MPSTTDEIVEQRGLFALFKGDSGTGKTVQALSFPTPYVFDFDRKMPNIALKHHPGKKVDYDYFDDMLLIADRINSFATMGCPYETIIFDSLTTLSKHVLTSYGNLKGEKTLDLLKKIQKTSGGSTQAEMMGVDYYNAETRYIKMYFLDALKTLFTMPGNPRHVILIGHVMKWESSPDLKTKQTTQFRAIVAAGKSVAAWIPTEFDDMFHFYTEGDAFTGNVSYCCVTQATGEDNAKTSLVLPAKIEFKNGFLYNQLKARDINF